MKTRFRGGVREGEVKEIATTKEEHPHPPKVIFDRERPGQEPKEVAHNPSTLEKGGCRSREQEGLRAGRIALVPEDAWMHSWQALCQRMHACIHGRRSWMPLQ